MARIAGYRLSSHSCFLRFSLLPLFWLAGLASAQTAATYHLHQEASTTSGLYQLKIAGPDMPPAALQSAQLRNSSPGDYVVKQFDTQAGVPGASGVIPAGSLITFTLWMRKTDNFGTLYPRMRLHLNSAAGTPLCTATGSSPVTTTLTQYAMSCTTASALTMAAADRFYLWAGVNMTAGPGNKSLYAELDTEGTLNGNYDSRVTVPLPSPVPHIDSLMPTAGEIGTPVTISGSSFGTAQGGSTVAFNGTAATPTNWSDLMMVAPVPLGATTGPVVVTVAGVPSNGIDFTAVVGTVSGVVSRAADGVPFSGVRVEALQSEVVKLATTSGGGGGYTITGLASGTYDVRVSLQGHATATTVWLLAPVPPAP